MFIEKELTAEEKSSGYKSYWEGYIKAKAEVYLIIKKYL
jgi:hypothetical protein